MEKETDESDGPARELRGLKNGDPEAIERLWADYFQRLVGLARKMLPKSARREADEEDVALSAFQSLCNAVDPSKVEHGAVSSGMSRPWKTSWWPPPQTPSTERIDR